MCMFLLMAVRINKIFKVRYCSRDIVFLRTRRSSVIMTYSGKILGYYHLFSLHVFLNIFLFLIIKIRFKGKFQTNFYTNIEFSNPQCDIMRQNAAKKKLYD